MNNLCSVCPKSPARTKEEREKKREKAFKANRESSCPFVFSFFFPLLSSIYRKKGFSDRHYISLFNTDI
jgi:hypothetical protein